MDSIRKKPDNKLTPNQWADIWHYDVGVNTFGRNGKKATVKYSQHRNGLDSDELFNQYKSEGHFNQNICCMVGRLSGHTELLQYARNGLYLNFADFDNQLAIEELCNYKGRQFTLEEFAKVCFVVQHSDDKTHCHVYWIASKPMAKRTLDKDRKIDNLTRNNKLPAIELKKPGEVAYCPGGYHESGNPYEVVGTREIRIIEELGEHIESICRKYKLPVSDSERKRLAFAKAISKNKFGNSSTNKTKTTLYDYDLEEEEWSDIYENSRNNTLFDRARRYYRRNKDRLSTEGFRILLHSLNQKWCKPPLPDFEVNSISSSILNFDNGNGGHD